MAIFQSATLGSSDPSRAMSIKALEARAQALAVAQSKQEVPQSMPSPWQGASHVFNQAADALLTRRADQQAAAGRQDLANTMSQIGPEGPTPQQQGQIMMRDPETGRAYMQEIAAKRAAAAEVQARKEAAATAAQTAETAAVAQEGRVQARPHSPLGELTADVGRKPTEEEVQAAIKKQTQGSPADQAAMGAARDENINLQVTQAKLDEAAGLLESGKVYSDVGAGYRTDYGQAVPGPLQGIAGVDPEKTAASKRYKQILSSEVVATLKALKGPASNKDMDWATTTINDPSAPLENKKQAMTILRAQMTAHRQSSEQTLKGMGTAPIKVEIPAAGSTTAAPATDPLGEARKAIASGAPKDKVIQRLKEKGIDASGL